MPIRCQGQALTLQIPAFFKYIFDNQVVQNSSHSLKPTPPSPLQLFKFGYTYCLYRCSPDLRPIPPCIPCVQIP